MAEAIIELVKNQLVGNAPGVFVREQGSLARRDLERIGEEEIFSVAVYDRNGDYIAGRKVMACRDIPDFAQRHPKDYVVLTTLEPVLVEIFERRGY